MTTASTSHAIPTAMAPALRSAAVSSPSRGVLSFAYSFTAVTHDLAGDHAQCQPDAQGDQHKVVQIPHHRDKVGNEVDGAEGIGQHYRHPGPRIPRGPRVAVGERERICLAFDSVSPLDKFAANSGHA